MKRFPFFFGFTLAGLVLAGAFSARAELKVAAIFGDNMVLQQGQPVPVWGWSNPGAEVTVKFGGQTGTVQADAQGRWQVKLKQLAASAVPSDLTVMAGGSEAGTVTMTNVLVGEVWLASGQSNMEKPLGQQPGQQPCFNFEQVLATAEFPQIRLFSVDKALAASPLKDLGKHKSWQACDSNALSGMRFSAAAYFFGREIHTNLNVPVGLIGSYWGGTRIEPWTPPAGFAQVPSLQALAATKLGTNRLANTRPTALYNAMIAPIAGFAIRGALWYQGESNCSGTNDDDYLTYGDKMAALVGGWRQVWGEGDFPFYFVQIAPFKYYGGKAKRVKTPETLPEFWTIQARAARTIPQAGMAATTDLVDDLNNIHPRDKASVGHRLALLARHQTYGQAEVVSAGPVFAKAEFSGGQAVLKFDHAEGGLASRDGKPLSWFTIAGADGKFVPARAELAGDTVRVSSPEVAQPVAVRFAWAETAEPNLMNGAGLPAEPFRTDAEAR